jgi:hypothetical protein
MHWTQVMANIGPWFLLVVGFGQMTLFLVFGRIGRFRREESPPIYWLTVAIAGGAGLVGLLMITGHLSRLLGFP